MGSPVFGLDEVKSKGEANGACQGRKLLREGLGLCYS